MQSLSGHFEALLKDINPPRDRAKLAKEMPRIVRDHLEGSDDLDTEEPHTRLVGSYARDTAIGDIKDVDLIVCVDREYGAQEPSDVLGVLRDVLGELPGNSAIDLRAQRRSVRVEFEHDEFFLDVVPAILPNGVESALYVPDRVQQEWILSDPIRYGEHLSELNSEHGKKVVPLIKLAKHWRDVHMKYRKPKSYWLEAEVFHLINGGTSAKDKSYAELFGATLGGMYSDFKYAWKFSTGVPSIADPMLGNDIAAKWARPDFERFMDHLEQSAAWCNEALAEDDEDECIALWRKVFGDEFADGPKKEATRRARLSKAGKLSVTSAGTIGEEGAGLSIPKHRFYGD